MNKVIIVDQKRCMGCRQCMVECAMVHADAATLDEALRCGESLEPRIHVEPVTGQFGMPLQCRHCQDAPCIVICSAKAINRASETGPVLLDIERCTGCGLCTIACPFGVITMSGDGKAAIKCDLCIERAETNQEPACVAGCPTGALQFRDLDEHLAERRKKVTEELAAVPGQNPSTGEEIPNGTDERGRKMVRCQDCGQAFVLAKQLEFVRAKLPEDLIVEPICQMHRRSRTAKRLLEIMEMLDNHPAPRGLE